MALKNLKVGLLSCLVAAGAIDALRADWTATGTFQYRDREFDRFGFTGNEPNLPIRNANVEIRDLLVNGGQQLMATTKTDMSGNFSVLVADSTTKARSIVARVVSTSTAVPGLFLSVTTAIGSPTLYAVTSSAVARNSPSVPPVTNLGSTIAVQGSGGDVFNIYDVALNTLEYLKFLNGSYPDSGHSLTLRWEQFSGTTATSFQGAGIVRVGDPSSYNDTVIQHETGHYAREVYSASDSPGGIHHLTDCNQDIRLAWEEGWATYFGQAVRLHFGFPNPQLYVKTTGEAGAGHLDFYFDVEDETPYFCNGAASEVVVQSVLWDILDSASSPDNTPGLEDPFDSLSAGDAPIWDVEKNYIRTATNRTLEDFWDGWFIRGNAAYTSMVNLFTGQNVLYFEDDYEPNNTVATATFIPTDSVGRDQTYFKDSGNGSGTTDTDYFKFFLTAGNAYIVQTRNLISDANTSLTLYSTDGVTQLASNDDRSGNDKSSLITFTPTSTGTYYVKSIHSTNAWGVYGSYEVAVGPVGDSPTINGKDPTANNQTTKVRLIRH